MLLPDGLAGRTLAAGNQLTVCLTGRAGDSFGGGRGGGHGGIVFDIRRPGQSGRRPRGRKGVWRYRDTVSCGNDTTETGTPV